MRKSSALVLSATLSMTMLAGTAIAEPVSVASAGSATAEQAAVTADSANPVNFTLAV